MRHVVFCLGLLAMASGVSAGDVAGTLKVDPVELVYGKEVPGKENLSATHYRFKYLFSSEENKAKFEKEPSKYEIQLGGACARMGALSGAGTTDIYAAHRGRIYLFASESCRTAFLKDPNQFLDSPDEVPMPRKMDQRRGQALLHRVLTRMGDLEKIKGIKSYQQRRTSKTSHDGKSIDIVETITLEFPDKIRKDSVVGKRKYSTVVTQDKAWKQGPDDTFDLHPQQREAAIKEYLGHNLLAMLKARKSPGSVVYHAASLPIQYKGAEVQIEEVKIHAYGATCTLGIEPGSGRVLRFSYYGQGPDHMYGDVEKTFTEFQRIDGILLPTQHTLRFNWKPVEKKKEGKVTQKIDVKLAEGFFKKTNT